MEQGVDDGQFYTLGFLGVFIQKVFRFGRVVRFKQTSTLRAHFPLQLVFFLGRRLKRYKSPTITTTHIENQPNKMVAASLVLKVCVFSGLIFLSRITSTFASVSSSTSDLQSTDFGINTTQGECCYEMLTSWLLFHCGTCYTCSYFIIIHFPITNSFSRTSSGK